MTTETEKLFSDIHKFVSVGRTLMREGKIMELNGLDDQVKILCETVLQLTQEERIIYADWLQELLGDLKTLGDELVVQRDLVADEIRGMPSHQKANVAYRKVDASDGYHERDPDGDDE